MLFANTVTPHWSEYLSVIWAGVLSSSSAISRTTLSVNTPEPRVLAPIAPYLIIRNSHVRSDGWQRVTLELGFGVSGTSREERAAACTDEIQSATNTLSGKR